MTSVRTKIAGAGTYNNSFVKYEAKRCQVASGSRGAKQSGASGSMKRRSRLPLPELSHMLSVQIFGVKSSPATRAAERFFKERKVTVHFVDLKQKPMAPGEIKRFIDRFGLAGLLDTESKTYIDAGLKYVQHTDAGLLAKIEREPKLLRLPLVRGANKLSVGDDEDAWRAMLVAPASGR